MKGEKRTTCPKCRSINAIRYNIRLTEKGVETTIYKCEYCGFQGKELSEIIVK